MPEWSKGADLRSAAEMLRGFDPHLMYIFARRGIAASARALEHHDASTRQEDFKIGIRIASAFAKHLVRIYGFSIQRWKAMLERAHHCVIP